ncbi:MAG: InlB B-repeat-containing protein [Symbiobacteriia bacterium]
MNALDALGIDTSKVPDGVDLNSTDNPYGRKTATINPVYELFVQGKSASTLYGHNKAVGKTWADFYSSQGDAKNNVITGDYAATATASGNFIRGTTGDQGQIVTVAAGGLSPTGGLYLYFSDPVSNTKGGAMTLLDTGKTIGNSGNQMNEDFAADAYLLQNYLKVATGDFDGDGVDEAAVYVAEQGRSRVEIYDLQIDATFNEGNASSYYLTTSHWAKAWTYYFNESPYVSNMVSLTSGDFNHDGTDDLALTWGYYYGSDNYTNSKAEILCGSKTSMLQKNMSIDLNYNNSQIVRAAFSYGDTDGDNVDDLILGGELNSDIAGGNLYSRFVAAYTYNGDSDSFIQSVAKNFDLFSKKDGAYVYPVMAGHHDLFYSLPTMVANVSPVNMQGIGHPSDIYIDSLIVEYGNSGLDIVAALDQNKSFNPYEDKDYPDWVRNTDGRFYTEYGVTTADFTGGSAQTLQVMMYYSAESYSHTVSYGVPYYRNWWNRLFGILSWSTVSGDETFSLSAETDMAAVQGVLTEQKDTTGKVTGYNFNVNVNASPVDFSTSFSRLNSDNDTAFINYTGEHGVMYSDPKVLAVLASPPYFRDLGNSDLSGSYMESGTSYSSTKGSGTEQTTSNTLSIGAYVSYQHDFEVFGVKVAGMETELAYTHGWTWDASKSSTMEMTVSYETIVGQDSVAFYSIPMEYYVYDSYVPIINESTGQVTGYDKQKMSVNLPHTAAVAVLSLDKYEKIAADYDVLPQISGTVLTHTVGDPATYPSSSAGYSHALEYDGDWSGVDYSSIGASVTQEIAITKENGTGLTNTNTVDFKIGAGPGDAIFGVSAGYEYGSSKVTVTSEGSTFSGTIYNMPAEAEQYGYYHAWKLFTYTYDIDGSTFPVVSYLVKDVTGPPSLPKDFAQDSTLTTDAAVGLTWSYPSASAIAGFQIYRYYEFPDGSGSYELAFIPASEVSYTTISDGALIRHYQYVDNGLADYTDYGYQIQTVRAAVPPSSILSDVLTARTKADKGYPTITLNGVTDKTTITYDDDGNPIGSVTDHSLLVFPDTSSTVSASIAESYAQTPRYQWQKLTDQGWQDIAGATQASHTYSASGVADEGQYRCRSNVIYEDEAAGQIYYISAYSDPFTLDYSTRTPKMVEGSFAVNLSNQAVAVSLKSSQTNHTFAPSGIVTFTITGADYASSYAVALGSPSADYVTTATLDLGATDHDGDGIRVNLPAGVYAITAYYGGSRVFGSLTVADPVYYVSGNSNGYLLNVNSAFTYGDAVTPRLMSVTAMSGAVEANEVSSGVTYKVYREQPVTQTYTYELRWTYEIGGTIYTYYFGTYTRTYTTYQYMECPAFIQSGGSVTARSAGSYTLEAYYGGTKVASQGFTVKQKDITIGFNNPLTGVAGNSSVSQPTDADLKVTSGNQLVSAYGDTLANLGLVVKAFNTAGTMVTISPATDPGLYTIVGAVAATPSADDTNYADYTNYNITYASSTYTLTGPKYDMTLVSARYGSDHAIVGTVEIIKPEIRQDNGAVMNMTTTAADNRWYGADVFTGGTAITLRATPQVGYQVKSWTVTTGTLSTTTVTPSTTLAIETTANNTTITVEYQLAHNQLYFQSANSSVHDGTVAALGNSIQSGAVVQPNATYNFVATPAAGYHFVEWTLSGSTNSNFTGNYDAATGTSTTPLTMGSVDTVLSAVFERDSYALTLSGNLQATYLVDDGFGNMVPTTSSGIIVISGDTAVTVGPKIGYSLSDGTTWYVDGVSVDNDKQSYTFTIAADTTVEVGTSQNTYDVSVSVSQPGTSTHNAVTVKVNNAITDFSATRAVAGGSALAFTALPAWGYVFDHWEVNSVRSSTTGTTLSVAALGEATSVEAVFAANPDRYTISAASNAGGGLTYSVLYNRSGYSGDTPTDAAIAASGTEITAYKGDTVVIRATPAANYMLRSWTVGDSVDESPATTLTLAAVSANMTVAARFIPMSFATVTYTAGSGGSITSATSDGVTFSSGDSIGNGTRVVLTVVPDSGNMVSYWTVDGETVKTAANTTFVGETLTIDSLTASSSAAIEVYFTTLVQQAVNYDLTNATVNRTYSPATYTGKTTSTASTDYVLSGSSAALTAVPNTGYRITAFTVNGNGGTENQDGTWSHTVDNVNSDLNVVALAEKLYTVTVDSGIPGGSITIATQKDAGQAIAGETITLNSVTPALDYTFGGWSYNGTDAAGATFTMPAADTMVSASFTQVATVAISYGVYDTNGSSEAGGLNGSIGAEIERTYGSGGSVSGYPVTDSTGSLTVNRGYSDSYASWPDSVVAFTATPDSGYMVKYWYVDGVKVTADTENVSLGANALTMTVGQGSANVYDVQVQYDLIGDKITYSSLDAHGTITSAVLTSAFGESSPISSGSTLTIGGTITFTALPAGGYQVEGWYVNGVKQTGETGTSYAYTATAGVGADVTVKFERVSYLVTYGGQNGTVTATKGSNSIGGSSAEVVGDSSVTFTAAADAGYAFAGWTVNGVVSSDASNPLTLTITADTTVTAGFSPAANCTITYGVTGSGGTLTATRGGSPFASGSAAAANDVITFTATPETIANGGANNYRVASWTMGGMTTATNAATQRLTVSGTTSVSVSFERSDYVVTYGVTGEGGTVVAAAGSAPINSSARVAAGKSVTFTATPASGCQVKSWTVDGALTSIEDTTFTVGSLTGDTTVMVEFEPVLTYTVTITASGTGFGSVTAKAGDAPAVTDATSVTVPRHGIVTLTALRYDANNAFSGWTVPTGAPCTARADGIVLTLSDVTGDMTIDAAFTPATMVELAAAPGVAAGDSVARGTIGVQVGYRSAGLMNTVDLSGSAGVQITSGMDVVATAVPDAVYMVQKWVVNGTLQDELSKTLILSGVTVDTAIQVVFEPLVTHAIPSSGDPLNGGHYTVEPGAKTPGDVGTDTMIRDRGTVTFTVKPDTGFYLSDLIIDNVDCLSATGSPGAVVQNVVSVTKGADGSYAITVANVTAAIQSTIRTAKPVVNITAPTNGTIAVTYLDGSGQTQAIASGDEVPVGTELTIAATPAAGYTLSAWGGAATGKRGTEITLTVPGQDITISATFAVPGGGGGGGGGGLPAGGTGESGEITTGTSANNDGSVTTTVTVPVGATVTDSTATASLDEATGNALIEQAKAAEAAASGTSGTTIVLDATVQAQVTGTAVDLPVATLNAIVGETSASLTLMTNTAQVVLDQTALSAVAGAASGDTVTLSVAEVDKATLPQEVQAAIGDAYVLDLTVAGASGKISSFGGGTATVRVPVPAGMIGKDMKVVYIADDGTLTSVTGSTITIDGALYYEFTTGHFSQYALMTDTPLPFTDVQDSDWYHSAVAYAFRNNLIAGTGATTFEPNATTTRAMLVTILWRLAGRPAANSASFSDVVDGTWYSAAVAWAKENGIVDGIGGGLFGPNDSITREQMALILYRYASHAGHDVSASGDTSQFTDSGKTSAWAADAMKWAVGAGLVSGEGGGILNPTGTATRAQVATILMRFSQ